MMTHIKLKIVSSSLLLSIFILLTNAYAQWGGAYTNAWISYGQPYVKIGVTQKGIHKISYSSLPSEFPLGQPENFQLWHRGKQVAILSISNKEILFYAVPNDGSLDSLLYRPMSSRVNPYTSLYSDESAYFLTVGSSKGLRAETINQPIDSNLSVIKSHLREQVTSFRNEYSLSTLSAIRPNFFNSFFENGASKTGVSIIGDKVTNYSFQMNNLIIGSTEKPTVKLLLHGRSNSSRNIEVYVGKDEQTLRLVNSVLNSNFAASEFSFELLSTDVDSNGKGIISLKSVSEDVRSRYSLAFYVLNYPQSTDMKSSNSYEFKFKSTSALWNRIAISNAPSDGKVYDITDIDSPKIIYGSVNDLMVSRKTGKSLNLLVTNEVVPIASPKITSLNLTATEPKNYNYIILTSEDLEEGALNYAAYRSSKDGGSYRTVVVKIKDVYNQFNFGEPSPVAIRRFMDYMLSDKDKDKFLFLLGKSITFNERMIRELPNEVPTIGFPGSDVLLVEGLAGVGRDIPAASVGRLSAVTNQQVADYLDKVKEYEKEASDGVGWKKNILHLNGGKTSGEITQLKNILAGLEPIVESGFFGGKVTPFVKQQGISEVETVNITPEVNAGVGMITYFGHGSTTVTDLDMGYITDAARGYQNLNKYPLMYFNGCGVGNVFSGRFNTSPTSSDRIALSLDWILAPGRGSVAIIANTFDTFVSSTANYLETLYPILFTDPSTSAMSIGQIHRETARRIIENGADSYEIANIHQGLLQGDPALHMNYVAKPDYALDPDESILLYSDSKNTSLGNSETIRTAVILSNLGRFIKAERVPIQIKNYYTDGTQDLTTTIVPAISYKDTLFVSSVNKKNILRVEVQIDPANTLNELSKTNNIAELLVDWDKAKEQSIYPTEKLKDIIPPLLYITFNDRTIKNDEVIKANPEMRFTVTDDRILFVDTTLINIFIKPCGDDNCDYKRLSFSGKQLIASQGLDNRSMVVNFSSIEIVSGIYSLLVTAKDKSGNASISPYEIRFKVEDTVVDKITLTCSPNPASTYVRFLAEGYDMSSVQAITWTIYDLKGVVLDSKQITPSSSGINEWYWLPQSGAGTYVYKATFSGRDKEERITGRVQVIH